MPNDALRSASLDAALAEAPGFDRIENPCDASVPEAASEAAFEFFMLPSSAGFGSELREWLPAAWAHLASACQRPRRFCWQLATRDAASCRPA
jgi:hypothetical protein